MTNINTFKRDQQALAESDARVSHAPQSLRKAAQAYLDARETWLSGDDAAGFAVDAAHDALRAALDADSAPALTVERLAEAISRACADHNEACWFRSSPYHGAAAILRALGEEKP